MMRSSRKYVNLLTDHGLTHRIVAQPLLTNIMDSLQIRILPRLDEATVYIYGFSFMALLGMSTDFRHFFFGTGSPPQFFVAFMYLTFGLLLIVFQIVGNYQKSPFEKRILLFYTITSSFMAVGFLINAESAQLFADNSILIPILCNLLYATLLLVMIPFSDLEDDIVSDEQIRINSVIVVSIVMLGTFIYCSLFTQMSIAYIYQWCIFMGFIGKNAFEF